MPPNQGWMVFQTPRDPNLIFWPIPSSIKNRGIPSRISMIAKGIKNAPAIIKLSLIRNYISNKNDRNGVK